MSSAVSRYYPSLGDVGQLHLLQDVRSRHDADLDALWLDVRCTCGMVQSVPADGDGVDVTDAHDRHVHAEWVESATIRSPADLAELPEESVIDDHGTIGVRVGAVWYFVGIREPFEPNLPVSLLRFGDGGFRR